jgi:hypothetical protein
MPVPHRWRWTPPMRRDTPVARATFAYAVPLPASRHSRARGGGIKALTVTLGVGGRFGGGEMATTRRGCCGEFKAKVALAVRRGDRTITERAAE